MVFYFVKRVKFGEREKFKKIILNLNIKKIILNFVKKI
uniref:Uncharacterized protein n=1 Tax=viral metagenome TaxID=1070528 RepID=A0A6C0J6Q9_9ZZZZ